MKDNWQIYKTENESVDFMGYRMNCFKTIIRKKIMFRITRRIKTFLKNKSYRNACAIVSYMGWIKNSDSWIFYHNIIRPYIDFTEIKKIIRGGKNESVQIRKQCFA